MTIVFFSDGYKGGASTFLEHLDIDNALYLDGNVSRLYSPKYDRLDFGFDLGPIVAVVAPDG